jgi:hypothetical protein
MAQIGADNLLVPPPSPTQVSKVTTGALYYDDAVSLEFAYDRTQYDQQLPFRRRPGLALAGVA